MTWFLSLKKDQKGYFEMHKKTIGVEKEKERIAKKLKN